jgi:uncharacterized membrane protein YadS
MDANREQQKGAITAKMSRIPALALVWFVNNIVMKNNIPHVMVKYPVMYPPNAVIPVVLAPNTHDTIPATIHPMYNPLNHFIVLLFFLFVSFLSVSLLDTHTQTVHLFTQKKQVI